jgi:predicted transcriptional regulator
MNDNIVFTLRMSPETAQRLALLAESTERSRAGVLRWLINDASYQQLMSGREHNPGQELEAGSKHNLMQKE